MNSVLDKSMKCNYMVDLLIINTHKLKQAAWGIGSEILSMRKYFIDGNLTSRLMNILEVAQGYQSNIIDRGLWTTGVINTLSENRKAYNVKNSIEGITE